MKGELEKRKKYPLGVLPGPFPEEFREQRERDAEKARNDAKHRLKCNLKQREAWENLPLMVHQREVRANLAIDLDYYRKLEAAKSKPPKALGGCSVIPLEIRGQIQVGVGEARSRKKKKLCQSTWLGRVAHWQPTRRPLRWAYILYTNVAT